MYIDWSIYGDRFPFLLLDVKCVGHLVCDILKRSGAFGPFARIHETRASIAVSTDLRLDRYAT